MEIIRVGVDLAKNVFQLHGVDEHEKPAWKRSLRRGHGWEKYSAGWRREPRSEWRRRRSAPLGSTLGALGYRVKLIAPQFVKPYVKSNKSDRNDAEAICEAMSRPSMRFVELKSVEQQDIQAVHRVHAELIKQRTGKVNQIRGLVGEYGLVAAQRVSELRRAMPQWLEDARNGLSERFRRLLAGWLKTCGDSTNGSRSWINGSQAIAKETPAAQRLLALRGVGPSDRNSSSGCTGDGEIICSRAGVRGIAGSDS